MARRGAGVGGLGHFAAVMLGGGVGTFCWETQFLCQLGWPLAGHSGTWGSPGSELGKGSRGPLDPPRVGCCGQPFLASQVAIAHHRCPLLTRVVWEGSLQLACPSQARDSGVSGPHAEAQPVSTFRRVSEQASLASRGSWCDAAPPWLGAEGAPLPFYIAL